MLGFNVLMAVLEDIHLMRLFIDVHNVNELLEVQHDLDLLKQLSSDEWKELFKDRVGRA